MSSRHCLWIEPLTLCAGMSQTDAATSSGISRWYSPPYRWLKWACSAGSCGVFQAAAPALERRWIPRQLDKDAGELSLFVCGLHF